MLSRSACVRLLQDPVIPLDRKTTAWLRCGERLGNRLEVIRDALARPFAPLRPGWPAPQDIWPVQVQQLHGGLDPALSYAGQLRLLANGEGIGMDTITVRRPERENTMAFARSLSEATACLRPSRRLRGRRLVGRAAAESAHVRRMPRRASRRTELSTGGIAQPLVNAATCISGESTVAA